MVKLHDGSSNLGFSSFSVAEGRVVGEVDAIEITLRKFFKEASLDCVDCYSTELIGAEVPDRLFKELQQLLTIKDLVRISDRRIEAFGLYDDQPVAACAYWRDSDEMFTVDLKLYGETALIRALSVAIVERLGKADCRTINWYFKGSHGLSSRKVLLPPLEIRLYPELYPNLRDPEQFLKNYLETEAPLLLLAGPPGTGKTTLLRYLLHTQKRKAMLVYDEKLLEHDGLFQSFLFSNENDLLIVEDADTILTSRQRNGNHLMARFLGVTDGLIKLPNKKVVFTTNIDDFSQIDEALIRPGRCFGLVHTRALTFVEAQAAAKVVGLPIPLEHREYTLAELFNQSTATPSLRRVGFS